LIYRRPLDLVRVREERPGPGTGTNAGYTRALARSCDTPSILRRTVHDPALAAAAQAAPAPARVRIARDALQTVRQ